jgi:hypothetical protein
MRKVHNQYPDVSQAIGDRGTAVVQRCFEAYGVTRAMDLPDEGKVRLVRDLRGFFSVEIPEGVKPLEPWEYGWRGALHRFWTALRRR